MVVLFVRTKYFLKVGFSISKKIGNSVVRNKTKRRLREVFRSLIPDLNKKYNYIVVAREAAAAATYMELLNAMTALLKKADMFIPEKRGDGK
jgi:ribonuclease P protein component